MPRRPTSMSPVSTSTTPLRLRESTSNARRARGVSRARFGGRRDRRAASSESWLDHGVFTHAASRARARARARAEHRQALYADRWLAGCDVRVLDRDLGVRLLADGRRRQADSVVG